MSNLELQVRSIGARHSGKSKNILYYSYTYLDIVVSLREQVKGLNYHYVLSYIVEAK